MTAEANTEKDSVTPLREVQGGDPSQAAPEAQKPRRPWKRRLLIVALPVLLAVAGGYVWVTGGRYIATEDAYAKQDRVTVVPLVSGRIDQVMVAENEKVVQGQPLFTIDDAAYRSSVAEAEAKLSSARLKVGMLKASHLQAVSDLATAREALDNAQTRDDRQKALLKSGVVSQSVADDSTLALQRAKGVLNTAEAQVNSTVAALAGDPDIPTDRHPEVMLALAELHGAELDLGHTVVTAPVSGVVSQTARLQSGQYATPAVPILTVVATGHTWVEANFKETELTHMQPGQPVSLHFDAFPDHPLTGVIGSMGAGTGSEFALLPAQNASGNWVKVVQRVPVRIDLEDGQDLPPVRTGMSVSVEVDTGHARGLPNAVEHVLAAAGVLTDTAQAAVDAK